MKSFTLFLKMFGVGLGLLAATSTAFAQQTTLGQCEVRVDPYGRTVTDCIFYRPDKTTLQRIYLGTEYFQDKVWHQGTVDIDGNGRELACSLSYKPATQTLLCRFKDSETETVVTPVSFSIGGVRFVNFGQKALGKVYRKYYALAYAGETRLLKQHRVELNWLPMPTEYKGLYNGWFNHFETYHIQHGDDMPMEVRLTKNSLAKALKGRSGVLDKLPDSRKITVEDVKEVLKRYNEHAANLP